MSMNQSDSDNGHVTSDPQDGYDLPLYGLDNGQFYAIHIPAIVCIVFSFISVVAVLVLLSRHRSCGGFFSWNKSERFMVYLAVCDGGYNVSHFTDHLHIVITKDHVYPRELCEYYGFTLATFITAQNLMVNVIAVNAFMLMYFRRQIDFGARDWRLLAWTFGVPFVGAAIAGITGQLGPNNAFCYFDGVKGAVTQICFTTVPLLIIMLMNTVLYIMTWRKIRQETTNMAAASASSANTASHRAARAMSLFVVAFFIQWWAMTMHGVWILVGEVPQVVYHFVTTFTNIGGVLNLGVYIIIRRRALLTTDRGSLTSKQSSTARLSGKIQSDEIVTSSVSTGS